MRDDTSQYILNPIGTSAEAYAARVAIRVYLQVRAAHEKPFDGDGDLAWIEELDRQANVERWLLKTGGQ